MFLVLKTRGATPFIYTTSTYARNNFIIKQTSVISPPLLKTVFLVFWSQGHISLSLDNSHETNDSKSYCSSLFTSPVLTLG